MTKTILFYFSGTGNTKYVTNLLAQEMQCPLFSIEDNIDFETLIHNNEKIGFCFPIYGSCPPRLMRMFVQKQKAITVWIKSPVKKQYHGLK